jgi:hypothetical protein
MLGLSPVLIGMREPNEKYLVDAFKFHSSHQFDPDRSSAFEGIAEYWGVTPAKDYYIGKYLMGVDRHYGNFVPQTPYGFPVILPEFLEKNAFWAKDKWETDGVSMYKGDKELNALAAKKDVLADFVKESKNLPFRAEGKVFMQAQRLASGSVRITLIDSGFIDPDDRETVLHIRDASEKSELKDLLSGEKIKIENNKASLIVPAGAFRILEFKN